MDFWITVVVFGIFFSGNMAEDMNISYHDYDICNLPNSISLSEGQSFNLTSPNFSQPNSYRSLVQTVGFNCETNILAEGDGFIAISIIDVDLGGPSRDKDSLRIKRNAGDETVMYVRGTNLYPKTTAVKSSNITVEFEVNVQGGPVESLFSSDPNPDISWSLGSESDDTFDSDDSGGDGDGRGGDIIGESDSYDGTSSFTKRRRRRREANSGPRGFLLELRWIPATAELSCMETDFTCRKQDIAVTCLPASHLCDSRYTCPDRSDEFDCDICPDEGVTPINGAVKPREGPYYIGQLLYFSCDGGYEMIGVKETQCTITTIGRVWRDPFPVCFMPPASTIDPSIKARERKETVIFLAIIIPSIAVCLVIAIGLLHLCTRHLGEQEKIYEAEWEAQQAAEKEAAEQAEGDTDELADPSGDPIAVIKILMGNEPVPDPTNLKVPLEENGVGSYENHYETVYG